MKAANSRDDCDARVLAWYFLASDAFAVRLFIDSKQNPRAFEAESLCANPTILSGAADDRILATNFRLIPSTYLRHKLSMRWAASPRDSFLAIPDALPLHVTHYSAAHDTSFHSLTTKGSFRRI